MTSRLRNNIEKPPRQEIDHSSASKSIFSIEGLRSRYPAYVEFVLFCIIGGTGVIVDYAVLIPLTELGGLDPRLAAVGAFAAAVTWNYVLNRRITFQSGKNVKVSKSYSVFVGVCLVGLAVRIGVMHALMEWLGMGKGRWYLLASLVGIAAATMVNFLGSKYFAFKDKSTPDPQPSNSSSPRP